MKIIYLGSFFLSWPPNRMQIIGLYRNNIDIKVYHHNELGISPFHFHSHIKSLLKDKLIKREINDCDAIIIGYPSFFDIPVVKKLLKAHENIFFNHHLSEYETCVEDRKLFSSVSIQAIYAKMLDLLPKRMTIHSIFDTKIHQEYFVNMYKYSKRMHVLPVGADELCFNPYKFYRKFNAMEGDEIKVLYFGTYVPLHGIEKILLAAKIVHKILPKVKFLLVGYGQTFPSAWKLYNSLNLKNVIFQQPVDRNQLSRLIHQSDICLGIFGKSEKAKRVVPQKVYQCAAMAKPIITLESPAMKEFFEKNIHCIMTKSNPASIAKSIIDLSEDLEKSKKLGAAAKQLFDEEYSSKKIGAKLINIVRNR